MQHDASLTQRATFLQYFVPVRFCAILCMLGLNILELLCTFQERFLSFEGWEFWANVSMSMYFPAYDTYQTYGCQFEFPRTQEQPSLSSFFPFFHLFYFYYFFKLHFKKLLTETQRFPLRFISLKKSCGALF